MPEILRSHLGDVQSLCYIRIENSLLLLSGGSDGTIVVWDGVYNNQLLSWSAHSGGVLSLQALPSEGGQGGDANGVVFMSQGRDGCIHAWELSYERTELVGESGQHVLVPFQGLPQAAVLRPPKRVGTLRVGFGGFCCMALLAVGKEGGWLGEKGDRPPPLLLLAAPALDDSITDIWSVVSGLSGSSVSPPTPSHSYFPHAKPLISLRVGEEDAARAARALVGEEGGSAGVPESMISQDLMKRAGAPTCVALLHDLWRERGRLPSSPGGGGSSSSTPATITQAPRSSDGDPPATRTLPPKPKAQGLLGGLLRATTAAPPPRSPSSPKGHPLTTRPSRCKF